MTDIIEMSAWHDQALKRFGDAIAELCIEIGNRHNVSQEDLFGWLVWFETEHSDHFAKYRSIEDLVDKLAKEGHTDAEAQRAFNDALRVWRNGSAWAIERYAEWKKQTAESQADTAGVPVGVGQGTLL